MNDAMSTHVELSKVFEPFTNQDYLRSGHAREGKANKYANHGMAMSIARQLVELHGGKMGIQSRCVGFHVSRT